MKRFLVILFVTGLFTLLSGCGLFENQESPETPQPSTTEEMETIAPEKEETSAMPSETSGTDEVMVKEEAKVEVRTPQTFRINMTASGFSPAEVSVQVGDTVNFVNTDTEVHWPASAIHPTHQNLPGFDALHGVSAGSTYAYTFIKAGTWGFHDHLHFELKGRVIVIE